MDGGVIIAHVLSFAIRTHIIDGGVDVVATATIARVASARPVDEGDGRASIHMLQGEDEIAHPGVGYVDVNIQVGEGGGVAHCQRIRSAGGVAIGDSYIGRAAHQVHGGEAENGRPTAVATGVISRYAPEELCVRGEGGSGGVTGVCQAISAIYDVGKAAIRSDFNVVAFDSTNCVPGEGGQGEDVDSAVSRTGERGGSGSAAEEVQAHAGAVALAG